MLLILIILLFRALNNESIVIAVFKVAGYTYGPILGLFVFSLYFKRKTNDKLVPAVAVLAPVISHILLQNILRFCLTVISLGLNY
jgi:hypothetical protein